jgi:hypothetical protein
MYAGCASLVAGLQAPVDNADIHKVDPEQVDQVADGGKRII